MLKKILIVCDGFLPPKAKVAGGKNIYLIQKYLALKGLEVHLAVFLDKETTDNWRDWVREEEKNFKFKFHVFNVPLKRIYPVHFLLKKFLSFFVIFVLQLRHKFDLLHEYSSMPFLVNFTYLLGWLTNTKTVHTLCTVNKGFLGSKRLLFKPANQLICASENMANELKTKIKTGVQFIPIPIEDRFFSNNLSNGFKKRYGITKEKVVLFCGPLGNQKGIAIFLGAIPEIIANNPDAAMVILTAPGLNTFSASRKNRERVISLTNIYKESIVFIDEEVDMPSLFSIADVYVYPLSTMHGTLGSPSVLIESMAMSKAIVASRLSELSNIVENGKNALLFDPKDAGQLAREVNRLLMDKDLRMRLGTRAKLDTQGYSLLEVGNSILSVYNKILVEK